MTLQCPVCDLRFAWERDLDDHLKLDHPDFRADPKTPQDAARRDAGDTRHSPGA